MHTLQGIASRWPVCLVLLPALLGACGMGVALEPEAFRREMAKMGRVESLDVNRSLRDIAAAFRERAPACLNATTTSQHGPGMRYAITQWHYTPRVVVTDRRVELHVQARYGGITLYEQGPTGAYVLLVHATPLDARRTRLEISRAGLGGEGLLSAVKGWASGTFAGCPVLD